MLSAVIHSRHSYPAGAFGKTAGRPEVSSLRSSRHVIGLSQKLVKSNPLFLGAQTISSPSLNEVGCWRVTYMCLSSMLSSTFQHHISPSCKSRNESLRGHHQLVTRSGLPTVLSYSISGPQASWRASDRQTRVLSNQKPYEDFTVIAKFSSRITS